MTDNDFLAAILTEPDDDVPRLIYADWLDEHGQPARAELLRLQCALARLPVYDPRGDALREQEARLLARHERRWLMDLPNLPGIRWGIRDQSPFVRGMAERVTASDLPTLADAWDRLRRSAPVRAVRVRSLGPEELTTLAPAELLEELAHLDLEGNTPGDPLGDLGARAVAACPHLPRLTALNVADNRLGPSGIQSFTDSPHLTGLTYLDVGHNDIGAIGAQALARSPHLSRLKDLRLWFNGIGDEGFRAMANSAQLPSLVSLNLGVNVIGNKGVQALAGAPLGKRLICLDLSHNGIGDAGAEALALSASLAGLTRLVLRGNPISPARIALLRDRFGNRLEV